MNKKGILVVFYIALILFGAVFLILSIPIAKVDDEKNSTSNTYVSPRPATIPFDYNQDIEIGENYIYNVSGFGVDAVWKDFSGGIRDWKTDINEQIYINFTGFFDRDPNVPGDTFPDIEMPWINISIFESGALLNYTNVNVSNSEVSRNLKLGIADFQPGFLITVNHTDWIKANATLEANSASADLKTEETYNFLYFGFEQKGVINNKTELIYDRFTGLLVWAKIIVGNYHLELSWNGYALDFGKQYIYNVNNWGKDGYTHAFWWGFHGYKGVYTTNPGGKIYVNFNGYYGRDSNDFGDIFPNNEIVWFNISFEYKGDFGSFIAFQYDNTTNPEAAMIMNLKYNSFASGFLVPRMSNETWLKERALEQGDPGGLFDLPGTVNIEETDLTIKITYDEIDGPQILSLLYEKRTGLLLWTDSISKNYRLTITIENYIPLDKTDFTIPNDDDDDDDDDKTKAETIPSFPLLITFGAIAITAVMIILKKKNDIKIKNV